MARTTVQDAIDRLTEEAEKIWLDRNSKKNRRELAILIIIFICWILSPLIDWLVFWFIAIGMTPCVIGLYQGLIGNQRKEVIRLKLIIRLKRLQAVTAEDGEINVGFYPDVSGNYDIDKIEAAVTLQEKKFAPLLEKEFGAVGKAFGGATPAFGLVDIEMLRRWASSPTGAAPDNGEGARPTAS